MPRIPYKPADITEPKELVAAIRRRRGGQLLNLDRMLLHSPALAQGWNALLREVRNALALPPKLRELSICAVAILNGADYELHHHAPEFLRAGGTRAQLDALQRLNTHHHPEAPLFDAAERAVIQLTRRLTCAAQVSDAEFAAVRSFLPDEQVVELVGVIAVYNMVSRFLVALQIEPEA